MPAMDDSELLKRFAATADPETFAELVRRNASLVYSAACRQMRDAHQAEDVTQAVFILLARKAKQIHDASVAGWLVRSTWYACRDAKKLLARRQFHERRAAEMNPEATADPGLQWDSYSSSLDEALASLSASDRDAVALRYLRGLNFCEVGAHIGTSEEAARKRVDSAVARLRRLISLKTAAPAAAVLATELSSRAVQAAPVHLVQSITAASTAAAKGTLAWAIARKVQKTMTLFKLKVAAAITIGVVLTGASTTALMVLGETTPSAAPVPASTVTSAQAISPPPEVTSVPLPPTAALVAPPSLPPNSLTTDLPLPTLITIHAHKTGARQVLEQIANQAGVKMKVWPDSLWNGKEGAPEPLLTLETPAGVPFWVAVDQFCRETDTRVNFFANDPAIIIQQAYGSPGLGGIVRQSSAFTIVANAVQRVRSAGLPDGVVDYNDGIEFELFLDPRIRLINWGYPWFIAAVDDAGASLLPDRTDPRERTAYVGFYDTNSLALRSVIGSLHFPPNAGHQIAQASGYFPLEIAARTVTLEFPDLQHSIGKSVSADHMTLTLNAFQLDRGSGNIHATLKTDPDSSVSIADCTLALVDANGQAHELNSMEGTTAHREVSASFSLNPATPPINLNCKITTETKAFQIPFEFRDLAIPR
jgi:RNA polymerase sigma factor (sigma-70 family)